MALGNQERLRGLGSRQIQGAYFNVPSDIINRLPIYNVGEGILEEYIFTYVSQCPG